MRRPVAVDLSRLMISARFGAPRGVQKVELGYARQLLADDSAVAVLPLGLGTRMYDAAKGRAFIERLSQDWKQVVPVGADTAFAGIKRRLEAGDGAESDVGGAPGNQLFGAVQRYWGLSSVLRFSIGTSALRGVPQEALFVMVGHTLLAFPHYLRWLDARPDVKPVFMIHDLIPLRHPELVPPHDVVLARRGLETTARHAAAIITPSEATASDLRRELAKMGRPEIPIKPLRLPVDDTFLQPVEGPGIQAPRPYFVAVGVQDRRKNYQLLAQAWRELSRCEGRAPVLVLAGARGWGSEVTAAMLQGCTSIVEAPGLSSIALRHLIAGARALLMPSLAEGFGIPVIEALACGTPVIASDIPAHREAGGTHATYLPPADRQAWLQEIRVRLHESEAEFQRRKTRAATFPLQTWKSYFAELHPFLRSI